MNSLVLSGAAANCCQDTDWASEWRERVVLYLDMLVYLISKGLLR
jgi:hypothetical protein